MDLSTSLGIHFTIKMSDLAPLVLSVIRDRTILEMKEEIDQLAAEVTKLEKARVDLLDHSIRHDDSVDITISINREIHAQGFLPTMPDYHDGIREVQFNVTKYLKVRVERTENIEIRLNGMMLATAKDPQELEQWRQGNTEMRRIRYQFDPSDHNVKAWRSAALLLYAREICWPNNERQMTFESASLE